MYSNSALKNKAMLSVLSGGAHALSHHGTCPPRPPGPPAAEAAWPSLSGTPGMSGCLARSQLRHDDGFVLKARITGPAPEQFFDQNHRHYLLCPFVLLGIGLVLRFQEVLKVASNTGDPSVRLESVGSKI